MRRGVLVALLGAAACAPREIKWSTVDPDELDARIRSLAGCVGDPDCVVVVDLSCRAFALNKLQAPAWYNRPVDESLVQNPHKCMPPRGETLYTARCSQRGLCKAVPP